MSNDTISRSILMKQSTKAVYLSGVQEPVLVYGHAIRESLGDWGTQLKWGPLVTESPFCAEQNGKIRFCVGYFVYEIHVIKHMLVQKPPQWLFVNNVCIKIINIGLKGLTGNLNCGCKGFEVYHIAEMFGKFLYPSISFKRP